MPLSTSPKAGNEVTPPPPPPPLSGWEGTLTPVFNGLPFNPEKIYLIYIKFQGAGGGFEGLNEESPTELVVGSTIEQSIHGSHGVKSKTDLTGQITKIWVKPLEYSVTNRKMLGPLSIWGAEEWGVFPWGGIVPENKIVWPKNTPWVFDRARQINAIRLVFHSDPKNVYGYFQMRNLHASYAWEIGNDNRQTDPKRLTYPKGVSANLKGLGKLKHYDYGLPAVVSTAKPRRIHTVPLEQVDQTVYFSRLMHIQAQGGEPAPVPYIYQPYTNDFGLLQATTFYGFPKYKGNPKLGDGLRYSGASVEITEARV